MANAALYFSRLDLARVMYDGFRIRIHWCKIDQV
jgi:hypothetical protein